MAAKKLGISQGAVSQHIKKLETFLQATLIVRSHTGCKPTPEGKVFLPYAENLIRMNQRAVGVLRCQQDIITVGASSNIGTYMLQPYIKSLLDEGSNNQKIDMVIHNNPTIAEKLDDGEFDVAVMEWWDRRPGYIAHLWRREELVVIVPPDHEWTKLPYIPRNLFKGASILGGEAGTGTGRLLARYFGDEMKDILVTLRLGSTEAVKQWVRAGLGVSLVLASTVENERRDGSLAVIPLEGEPLHKDLFVIWRDSLLPENPSHQFAEGLLNISFTAHSHVSSQQYLTKRN